MAEITIQGWLAKDAELRFTSSGTPVTTLVIPENHKRKNQQTGQWEDTGETTWREVTIWHGAEWFAQNLRKGDEVIVHGSEKLEVSESNGRQYHRLKVTPRTISKVMRPPKQQGGNQQQGGFQQGNQAQQSPATSDPWGQQSGGNYDWGAPAEEQPPF